MVARCYKEYHSGYRWNNDIEIHWIANYWRCDFKWSQAMFASLPVLVFSCMHMWRYTYIHVRSSKITCLCIIVDTLFYTIYIYIYIYVSFSVYLSLSVDTHTHIYIYIHMGGIREPSRTSTVRWSDHPEVTLIISGEELGHWWPLGHWKDIWVCLKILYTPKGVVLKGNMMPIRWYFHTIPDCGWQKSCTRW